MLGIEGHGIMTFFLNMEGDGWGQGMGGYACDASSGEKSSNFMVKSIRKILETLEVDTWEELPGKYCRIKRKDGMIVEVGHITKNKWFNIKLAAKAAADMS